MKSLNRIVLLSIILTISIGQIFNISYAQERTVSTGEILKSTPPINGKATITEENAKLPPPINGKATITEENAKLPPPINGKATITGEDAKQGSVTRIGNSVLASPNITPNQPSGWGDKIVVSNVTGTTTDAGTIYTNENVYVDWSVTNNGTAATAVTFYAKLYVDDIEKGNWQFTPPMNVGTSLGAFDVNVGTLSAGVHTFKVIADVTNVITESNESDNQYSKTKTITQVVTALPNITPNQPSGWGDKIVVSNVTGTTTDASTIYTNENVYVDWSLTNNGTAATAVTFYAKLYVDDIEKGNWSITAPMNVGASMGAFDTNIGKLTAGTHTFKIITDVTSVIAESNENDNEYQRSKIIIINNTPPVIRIEPTSITIMQ